MLIHNIYVIELYLQVHEVPVVNKDGLTRHIGVRYTHHYPLEKNEWGEFQVVDLTLLLWVGV